jgi:type I restriction enzyme, S subunit
VSDLPSGWALAKLSDVAQIIRGVTYQKAEAKSEPLTGYLPILRATNIAQKLLLSSEMVYVPARHVKDSQQLQDGDIVVATSSGSASVVGKSAQLRQPWSGGFGAFCSVIRHEPAINPRYLAHFVASSRVRRAWRDLAQGTNINNLKTSDLATTSVPVAPLAEQERIVAAIEEQFSRLDAGVAALERVRRNLKRMRAAVLQAAFAEASSSRRRAQLSEVASTQLGRMLSAGRETMQHSKPYLRNRDVQWGRIETGNLPVMDFKDRDADKYRLLYGDLLVCEGGEVGRAAVWLDQLEECYYQKALHRIRCSAALDVNYLRYLLEHYKHRRIFDQFTTGTTIDHLPQEDLRTLPIPLPPIQLQRRIVSRLESELSVIEHQSNETLDSFSDCAALR